MTDILFLAVIIEEYCVKAQGKNELYVMQDRLWLPAYLFSLQDRTSKLEENMELVNSQLNMLNTSMRAANERIGKLEATVGDMKCQIDKRVIPGLSNVKFYSSMLYSSTNFFLSKLLSFWKKLKYDLCKYNQKSGTTYKKA